MMNSNTIPLLEVSGTHRQIGLSIGEHMRSHIQVMHSVLRSDLPEGVTWEDFVTHSNQFLNPSRLIYPQYIEELEGIAVGANIPFEELFLFMCEELWEASAWRSHVGKATRGCTDLAARGEATVDGSTLIAHTNDLLPETQDRLVILKVHAPNEPEFLGVSVGGVGISAGFNAAGISLTGNQVDNNDIRPGVPRLMIVRAILSARRLGEALDTCLLPQRASSYNNVIADSYGEVYSMEGSATDCEPIYIDGNLLAHANHYSSVSMRRFEANRNEIGGSVIRHNRAMRLLRENYGQHSPELFQKLISDHANFPASICKHGTETVTVFSMIVDTSRLKAWIGLGRPCETTYQTYSLTPYFTQRIG